jgi:lipopolysaccharide export system protein LptA
VNRHLISRYALLAAIAAGLVALVVAVMFVRREWQAAQALRMAPPPVPKSVQQQSLEFTFSRVVGKQTVFTIHAARATEYQGKKQSLLESVDISVHGNRGERNDRIQTRACDYQPETGSIVCQGVVKLDLESVPVPGEKPKLSPGGIHIETKQVGFNRETGEATTDAPVLFRFPEGEGRAVGVTYFSRQPNLELGRDVELTLAPNRPGGAKTTVNATALDYDRTSGQMVLTGPVRIRKGDRSMESSRLTIELDKQLRPRRAIAAGRATVGVREGARQGSAAAENVEILFDGQGRAVRLNAAGNVLAKETGPEGMRLAAKEASAALDPGDQSPRSVEARGNVEFDSRHAGRTARLNSQLLRLALAPVTAKSDGARAEKKTGVRLARADSPGAATAEWQSGTEQLRLKAGHLAAIFAAANQIQRLDGGAGIQLERRVEGAAPVQTSADALRVLFSGGEWSEAGETGNVRATQGTRTASAQKARWVRADDTVELSGAARFSDPTAQTLAETILWNQKTERLRASGRVQSSYLAGRRGESGVGPSAGPANVVADSLEARPSAGEAVYAGHARLWQGDLVIQADRIEVERTSGMLVAEGNVVGALPQTPARPAGRNGGAKQSGAAADGEKTSNGAVLWRVLAQKLTYQSGSLVPAKNGTSGTVTLEGGVRAASSRGRIDAKRLVLHLTRDVTGRAELARAEGEGNVMVREGNRWGRAERCLYDAGDGKFVLSGGKPALHDTAGDVVRGDRLTFYVSDDTILIESTEGTRTLTLHPVPK